MIISTLEYFDLYREKLNWKIISVRPKTKQPVFKSWSKYYNHSQQRRFIEKTPTANLGLILGDLVDIEGDTPEANEIINEWLKDFPHTFYHSEKSIHHLFINPFKKLTRINENGIEFRGHNHHSMLPPSVNKNGVRYRWMPQSLIIPGPLPKHVHDIIKNKLDDRTNNSSVEPWCSLCKRKYTRNIKRFNLELSAFKIIGSQWQCLKCREIDVREAVRLLRSNQIDKAKKCLSV